jgi:hypothetical protein
LKERYLLDGSFNMVMAGFLARKAGDVTTGQPSAA